MTPYKLNGYQNLNFISNDIFLDVVARLRNQGNCNLYRMYFIRDGIVDSLMNNKKYFI